MFVKQLGPVFRESSEYVSRVSVDEELVLTEKDRLENAETLAKFQRLSTVKYIKNRLKVLQLNVDGGYLKLYEMLSGFYDQIKRGDMALTHKFVKPLKLDEQQKLSDPKTILHFDNACFPGGWILASKAFFGENVQIFGSSLVENDKAFTDRMSSETYASMQIPENGDVTKHSVVEAWKGMNVDLYTCDLGVDIGENYRAQEVLHQQPHLGAALAGLYATRVGGVMILKIFLPYTEFFATMISLLTRTFKSLFIVKPICSKNGNAEVYLVCVHKLDNQEVIKLFKAKLLKFSSEPFPSVSIPFNLELIVKELSRRQIFEIKTALSYGDTALDRGKIQAILSARYAEFSQQSGIGMVYTNFSDEQLFPKSIINYRQPRKFVDYAKLRTAGNTNFSLMPWHMESLSKIYSSLFKNLDEIQSILDATAHIGVDTLFLSTFFPGATIKAVEVDPQVAGVLEHNVSTNSQISAVIGNGVDEALAGRYNIIFFDPPWGGDDYSSKAELVLKLTDSKNKVWAMDDLILELLRTNKCDSILLKAPLNYKTQITPTSRHDVMAVSNHAQKISYRIYFYSSQQFQKGKSDFVDSLATCLRYSDGLSYFSTDLRNLKISTDSINQLKTYILSTSCNDEGLLKILEAISKTAIVPDFNLTSAFEETPVPLNVLQIGKYEQTLTYPKFCNVTIVDDMPNNESEQKYDAVILNHRLDLLTKINARKILIVDRSIPSKDSRMAKIGKLIHIIVACFIRKEKNVEEEIARNFKFMKDAEVNNLMVKSYQRIITFVPLRSQLDGLRSYCSVYVKN